MRNILSVNDSMEAGRVDIEPVLRKIAAALDSDAIVLNFSLETASSTPSGARAGDNSSYTVTVRMRLADVIVKAEEAVQVARKLSQRLTEKFGKDFKVEMTAEPASAQRNAAVTGNLVGGGPADKAGDVGATKEYFYAAFKISKGRT